LNQKRRHVKICRIFEFPKAQSKKGRKEIHKEITKENTSGRKGGEARGESTRKSKMEQHYSISNVTQETKEDRNKKEKARKHDKNN
jgi:hypothetical protein